MDFWDHTTPLTLTIHHTSIHDSWPITHPSPEDQRVEAEQHEVSLLPPEHEATRAVGVGQPGGLDKPRPGKYKGLDKKSENIWGLATCQAPLLLDDIWKSWCQESLAVSDVSLILWVSNAIIFICCQILSCRKTLGTENQEILLSDCRSH